MKLNRELNRLLLGKAPERRRPKEWVVVWPTCTGRYKSKREAREAMEREGGLSMRPVY